MSLIAGSEVVVKSDYPVKSVRGKKGVVSFFSPKGACVDFVGYNGKGLRIPIVYLRRVDSDFAVGDSVKIRQDSKYYGRDDGNPADVVGVISEVLGSTTGSHSIVVEWPSPHGYNCYRRVDLEFA